MVQKALDGWDLNQLDILFVENVGNLVCPSAYDLGENLRLVLVSVTEGEDKPLKYPTIFNSGDVAIITKMDLAAAVEFDYSSALRKYPEGAAGHGGIPTVRQDGRGHGEVPGISRDLHDWGALRSGGLRPASTLARCLPYHGRQVGIVGKCDYTN